MTERSRRFPFAIALVVVTSVPAALHAQSGALPRMRKPASGAAPTAPAADPKTGAAPAPAPAPAEKAGSAPGANAPTAPGANASQGAPASPAPNADAASAAKGKSPGGDAANPAAAPSAAGAPAHDPGAAAGNGTGAPAGTAPSGADAETLPVCHEYDASPVGGEGFMSKNGREYYVLSLPKRVSKAPVKPNFYQLYQVTLGAKEQSVKKLAGFPLSRRSVIFGQGDPVQGLGVFSFADDEADCHQGEGSAMAFSFLDPAKTKIGKVISGMRIKLLYSLDGFAVADLAASAIKTVDLAGFMSRAVLSYPAGEEPISFTRVNSVLVTVKKAKEGLVLSRYANEAAAPNLQARMAPGSRIVKDGPRLGFASINAKTNEVLIQEKKAWSDTSQDRVSRLKLPTGYPVGQAAFDVSFAARVAVVTAAKPEARKRWNRAFLFDMATGKLLTAIKAPADHYIAAIDYHAGKKIMVAVIKHRDETLAGISLYFQQGNKWLPLTVPD